MSEPFIAEVRIFAGNFAPRGWAFCNGQILPIDQNSALFSLVGTTYGGDGRTTFALPDLRGRAPLHPGRGPGLSDRRLGERGGQESVVLTDAEIPAHTHRLQALGAPANDNAPQDNNLARSTGFFAYAAPGSNVDMDATAVGTTGGGQAHENRQPSLALNFIIALTGLFPSRS